MKPQTFRLVITESPFAGDTEANQRYASTTTKAPAATTEATNE